MPLSFTPNQIALHSNNLRIFLNLQQTNKKKNFDACIRTNIPHGLSNLHIKYFTGWNKNAATTERKKKEKKTPNFGEMERKI